MPQCVQAVSLRTGSKLGALTAALLRAVVQAFRWKNQLVRSVRDGVEPAEAKNLNALNRSLTMQLQPLMRWLPLDWSDQRAQLDGGF